jgi:TRAP-type C4-dicarboxylate transport system permease small subunit
MIKVLGKINSAFAALGALLVLFVMISICYGVITRPLGLPSPIWIVQVNEYCLVWICFLATAWVLAENKHVRVDILSIRFSHKGQTILRLIQDVVSMGLCGLFCYLGVLSVWEDIRDKVVDVQSIDVPKAWIIVVIPVGFLLLTLQFVIRTMEDAGNLKASSGEGEA